MSIHEHKMTRLNVGPPKRYYCETPGCDYEMPVETARIVMKDAPSLVTSTVAAMNGEVMLTPVQIPVVVTGQAPTSCPKCGWTLTPKTPEQRAAEASERMAKARAAMAAKRAKQKEVENG